MNCMQPPTTPGKLGREMRPKCIFSRYPHEIGLSTAKDPLVAIQKDTASGPEWPLLSHCAVQCKVHALVVVCGITFSQEPDGRQGPANDDAAQGVHEKNSSQQIGFMRRSVHFRRE